MTDELADILNKDCFCISVDREALQNSLNAHLKGSGLPENLLQVDGHLFAESPVFLQGRHVREMQQLIDAVESISRIPQFRETVLAAAPASARRDFGPRGVYFSYDFHLAADGPRLIEINTNAGGTLLSLYMASAQQACCDAVTAIFGAKSALADAENEIITMFEQEWVLHGSDKSLSTVAIVDDDPSSQFLYPEFQLFKSLFERHGIEAVIGDPGDFSIEDNTLWLGEQRIDLVYNRLTDFYLQAPGSACLLEAYQNAIAAFTPSPHIYALYADKRNLPLLSDSEQLRAFGAREEDIDVLSRSLPATVLVTQENAEQLWAKRKSLFFKPATGFGSRGAYRGAKLTKRVWTDILQSDYVAQELVPPSKRELIINGEKQPLKVDIRCVTYKGKMQNLTARLYEGQTTNLRTKGGGLATVFSVPDSSFVC